MRHVDTHLTVNVDDDLLPNEKFQKGMKADWLHNESTEDPQVCMRKALLFMLHKETTRNLKLSRHLRKEKYF